MASIAKIPDTDKKRVVIVGAGFAGLKLARELSSRYFQVVLLDLNNFHQFQPLFYQVATSGLEPSAIAFPLRKIFQHHAHVHFRVAELLAIDSASKSITTSIGSISYAYLVLAFGATTNFFNNERIQKFALPMKSIGDALMIRNFILQNFEKALQSSSEEEEVSLMNIVIVGGGPTGVELAGALAEMRKFILPKDYPELDFDKMKIYLFEGAGRLLNAMSENSSLQSKSFLEGMGVEIHLESFVTDYDGSTLTINDGTRLHSNTVLWAAGVRVPSVSGLGADDIDKSGRIKVGPTNELLNNKEIYALGDCAIMEYSDNTKGHPQVAQPAIQQGHLLAKNLLNVQLNKPLKAFRYNDQGSLATIGRNKAVADLNFGSFSGFIAWVLWLFVHLMSLVGKKNKLFVFLNWVISYFTYDKSFRLLIKPSAKDK